MDNQKKSYLKILTGTIVSLVILGAIFYFGKDSAFVKNLFNKTAPSTATPAITSIAEETVNIRQTLDVEKDTQDWKTYTNSEGFFSLKYPPDIILTEDIQTKRVYFPFSSKCVDDICEGVYLGSEDLPEDTILEEFIDQNYSGDYHHVEIDSLIGLEAFLENGDFQRHAVFLKKGDQLYAVELNTGLEKGADHVKKFNLMLKSLKFLK